MVIAEINEFCQHSTGNIMLEICRNGWANGYEIYTFSSLLSKQKRKSPWHFYIGNYISRKSSRVLSNITGLNGFFHIIPTLKTLYKFDKLKVDLIHLHDLYGYCINFPLLFKYIKRKNIPVVWTLHCTWAYTGKCTFHSLTNCDKWIDGCHNCEQRMMGHKSIIFDNSSFLWKKKKKWTESINLTPVTPSEYMATSARKSFLKCHDTRVIYNGINQYVFYPRDAVNFKKDRGIEEKVVLLGVASYWRKRKGLDVMIELANRLDENKYKIVLVGTDDEVDKDLPNSIISIHRTEDKNELAELYSAADIFVMPSRAESFGLVTVEALACGTPVIAFDVGPCSELIDETCGALVDMDDIDALVEEIKKESREHNFKSESCVKRASQFTLEKMADKYLALYSEILNQKIEN